MKLVKKIVFLVLSLVMLDGVYAMETATSANESSTSIFVKKQNFDQEGVELYSSNLHMKKNKVLGFGLATGGVTGLIGVNAEINIQPEDALYLGMGAGQSYSSFNFGYKKNFEGIYLSPYTKVGFSKWLSGKSDNGSAKNSDILKRVLSEKEIRENKFSVNFLTASAGLEYNQLEGELSGVNFFGEVVLMGELSNSTVIPTGSIGMTYFY